MSCNPNARYFIGDESQKPRYQAHVGYKAAAPNAYRAQAPAYSARVTGLYNSLKNSFYNSPAYSAMARGMATYKPASESEKPAGQPANPTPSLAARLPNCSRALRDRDNWAYEGRRQPQTPQQFYAKPLSLSDLQERLAEMAFAPKKRKPVQYETDYELYQPNWWVADRAAA